MSYREINMEVERLDRGYCYGLDWVFRNGDGEKCFDLEYILEIEVIGYII